MIFFEIEIDEDQIRKLVKAIINEYESGLHRHGNQADAILQAQDKTMETMEVLAEHETHLGNPILH